MQRRSFLLGASAMVWCGRFLHAQGLPPCPTQPQFHVLEEDSYPSYDAYLEAQYPLPKLHAIIPLTVNLQLTWRLRALKWGTRQAKQMQRAALLFQTVWASSEFKDRVSGLGPLILQDGTVKGPELYAMLVREKNIQLNVAREYNLRSVSFFGGENAVTESDLTKIEKRYLDANDTLVYDLVNTLSHEYTHYTAAGASWDEGHSQDLRAYVSYGIGALTENLAAGRINDIRDPSYPPCKVPLSTTTS